MGSGLGTSLQPRQLPSCSVSRSTQRAGATAGERTAACLLAEAAGPRGHRSSCARRRGPFSGERPSREPL